METATNPPELHWPQLLNFTSLTTSSYEDEATVRKFAVLTMLHSDVFLSLLQHNTTYPDAKEYIAQLRQRKFNVLFKVDATGAVHSFCRPDVCSSARSQGDIQEQRAIRLHRLQLPAKRSRWRQ